MYQCPITLVNRVLFFFFFLLQLLINGTIKMLEMCNEFPQLSHASARARTIGNLVSFFTYNPVGLS